MLSQFRSGLTSVAYFALLAVLIIISPARVLATSYYLAPAAAGGSDSNNGTSPSTPWLTPHHALNCGDVITAAVSLSYDAGSFQSFGTVTCSAAKY